MKKLALSLCSAAIFVMTGCATQTQNVLQPTPEEVPKFAQHKLSDVPNGQEALIYVINWSSDEKQRIRPLHVKVGDQVKVIEAAQYSLFRVKPEAFNITVTGVCRVVTPLQLKSGIEATPPTFLLREIWDSHYGGEGGKTYGKRDAKQFSAEAGKTYFLWLNAGCFLNRIEGQYNMYSHINTVTEERGRYLTFKTRPAL